MLHWIQNFFQFKKNFHGNAIPLKGKYIRNVYFKTDTAGSESTIFLKGFVKDVLFKSVTEQNKKKIFMTWLNRSDSGFK